MAYGLRVHSTHRLPELVETDAGESSDISVRWGQVRLGDCDATASRPDLSVSTDGARFLLHDVATYHVRDGREIIIDPVSGADEGLIRFNLLGLGLGMLMHQRGLVVLHASVVAIDGAAVAFLGFSGDGKSTTAAAMIRRGHAIVADDVAAIQIADSDTPVVLAAFPELRLLPESAQSLGLPTSATTAIYSGATKRSRRHIKDFSAQPLPIRRIYVLADGARNEIQPLRPAAACAEFMRHSLVAGILKPTGTALSHFQNCVQLAQSVPVAKLVRRRSLAALDDLAALIEGDIVQIA
jgi:hypothetical protein